MIMKNTNRIRAKLLYLAAVVLMAMTSFHVSARVAGDMNNDGVANINDVTVLTNALLSGHTQWTQDVNGDGKVSIADVTALIYYLLSGDWPWAEVLGPARPDNAVVYMVNGYQLVMVPVEGGTFMMGSTVNGESASPVHQVTLSDYSIGMTEVTYGLWKAVTGSYPPLYAPQLHSDEMPHWYCSWDEAKAFISQLNELTGLNFHLPSEAQWEFAARGGNLSKGYKYSGSNNIDEVAWYTGNSVLNECHCVGMLKPNELGLYDMSGNVVEFCEDDYMSYTSEAQTDPVVYYQNSSLPFPRVLRGGHKDAESKLCTVTNRYNYYVFHGEDLANAGFRLVL